MFWSIEPPEKALLAASQSESCFSRPRICWRRSHKIPGHIKPESSTFRKPTFSQGCVKTVVVFDGVFLKKSTWVNSWCWKGPALDTCEIIFFWANLGFREYSRISPIFFSEVSPISLNDAPNSPRSTMQKSRCKKRTTYRRVFPIGHNSPARGRRSSGGGVIRIYWWTWGFFQDLFFGQSSCGKKTCRLP